jgi:CRP/FNR family transcriptional regulator/CRP/FNR family cyclic AMP-dependent transcriptional regulator
MQFLDSAAALARSQLFHDMPIDTLQELAKSALRRTYRRGDVVVRQGEPGDALYVLLSGEVKVLVEAPSGERAVVAILGPGDGAGELSLIDGEPRSATVEAIDDVAALVLLRRDFLDFIHQHPDAMERLLVTLVGRLRRADELAAELARLDTRGRLAKTLLDLAREHGRAQGPGTEIELPITQGDLAAMVGATRERVNRILGGLEQDGAIQRRGRHIIVLDPDRLRQRIA